MPSYGIMISMHSIYLDKVVILSLLDEIHFRKVSMVSSLMNNFLNYNITVWRGRLVSGPKLGCSSISLVMGKYLDEENI